MKKNTPRYASPFPPFRYRPFCVLDSWSVFQVRFDLDSLKHFHDTRASIVLNGSFMVYLRTFSWIRPDSGTNTGLCTTIGIKIEILHLAARTFMVWRLSTV